MTNHQPISTQALNGATGSTPWNEARKQLEDAEFYWLATVHPDGRPHVMPVLAIWMEDGLYFSTSESSRKGRNLANNSCCVVTTATGIAHLVVEGKAARLTDADKLQRVADVYATKYDWHVTVTDGMFYGDGAPTAGPPPYQVYKITLEKAFGFGVEETFSATRWHF